MTINFDKGNGLVPVIIQHYYSNQVLMLGYMNDAALKQTLAEKKVTFYSRSKQRLWTKGETSGNFLNFKEILVDCDEDTLLIKAVPSGAVCHKGSFTCFEEKQAKGFIYELQNLIAERKKEMPEDAYTTHLFKKGVKKIAQKVGEEATEVILEAMDNNNKLLVEESADLLYHWLVLLQAQGLSMEDVEAILKERHIS